MEECLSPTTSHSVKRDSTPLGSSSYHESIARITLESVERESGAESQLDLHLDKDIVIGRDPDRCDLSFDSSLVSKRHLRIYSVVYDEEKLDEYPPCVYCQDLGSTNGTYVNDTFIGSHSQPRTPYLLGDGDTISIRPHWTFAFHQASPTNKDLLDEVQRLEIQYFDDRFSVSSFLLGKGRYGAVFSARNILTRRQLACKIVPIKNRYINEHGQYNSTKPSSHSQSKDCQGRLTDNYRVQKRAEREIEILSTLNHPNIITLHKAFRSAYNLYLFTELAAGGDLFSFVQANGGSLPHTRGMVVIRQIVIGVNYLHSRGVVHRDLKLDNILVMQAEMGHRIVLTDFGGARFIKKPMQRMSSLIGTVEYQAPEILGNSVIKQKPYTKSADMWSLGIVAIMLLTGSPLQDFDTLLPPLTQNMIKLRLDEEKLAKQVDDHSEDLLRRLLVLDDQARITAQETLKHIWFRNTAGTEARLNELDARANRLWSPRDREGGVIEDLPDLDATSAESSSRIKARDVSASPYFSLNHLVQSQHLDRGLARLNQKRMIEDLQASGQAFMNSNKQHKKTPTQSNFIRDVDMRDIFESVTEETKVVHDQSSSSIPSDGYVSQDSLPVDLLSLPINGMRQSIKSTSTPQQKMS